MSVDAACLHGIVGDGEILIIVPPFASIDRPSLAAHLLQACAGAAGFQVRVLYANLAFAAEIGAGAYTAVSYAPTFAMVGERLFATSAHGDARRTNLDPSTFVAQKAATFSPASLGFGADELLRLEARAVSFSDMMAKAIA